MKISWDDRGNPRMGRLAGVVVASMESARDGTVTAWNELIRLKFTQLETFDAAKAVAETSVREALKALAKAIAENGEAEIDDLRARLAESEQRAEWAEQRYARVERDLELWPAAYKALDALQSALIKHKAIDEKIIESTPEIIAAGEANAEARHALRMIGVKL